MRTPIWIDTDPGIDDAFAIFTAFKQDELDIAGISAVAGNAAIADTFKNARNIVSFAGHEDVPVYAGADRPLVRDLVLAESVHGNGGLNGVVLPESRAKKETKSAWDALHDTALKYPGSLELILLGPDTNAAIAFSRYPDLAHLLKRILIMGGAAVGGNITPYAEFNMFTDPHAAKAVFESGVPIVMCGLDVTLKALLTESECQDLASYDSRACRFFAKVTKGLLEMYRKSGIDGIPIHDVCPVLYAAHPEIFKGQKAEVCVETGNVPCIGQTVTDLQKQVPSGKGNALVVTDVDRNAFASYLMRALK